MVNTTGVEPAQISGGGARGRGLPLSTLNHISVVCRCLKSSLSFYTDVLGFVPIHRPGSLDFAGAWLFNYGIGIHLLQAEDPESMPPKKTEINPKDNHISFQCESIEAVHRRLKELGIKYVERRVEEGGIYVDQVFFHDPDGFMIEVCTCDNLPIVPLVPDGYDILRMPHSAPPPACKRPSPPLPVPAAVLPPPPTTPAPPAQCVPAMASGGSYVVGEVEAMRSCPDRARVHAGLMIHSLP
ncbi:hypothetical protein PR202_ga23317 [Eleusine coracana subsp. coracana]|uniref:VOC domain-containing protein n=1 Tax=Eleusine coracana subsp. coracana TaxID=191504 RepID=A0AAV5D6C0_ELECO|nr:hypothetical protein QOZ80_1AG0011500 [Eleusine coracana subsp. coracana]GJN05667.1 hypothetical protein PR202_ga23317 [Eleusine coracana subsp. coracana]